MGDKREESRALELPAVSPAAEGEAEGETGGAQGDAALRRSPSPSHGGAVAPAVHRTVHRAVHCIAPRCLRPCERLSLVTRYRLRSWAKAQRGCVLWRGRVTLCGPLRRRYRCCAQETRPVRSPVATRQRGELKGDGSGTGDWQRASATVRPRGSLPGSAGAGMLRRGSGGASGEGAPLLTALLRHSVLF